MITLVGHLSDPRSPGSGALMSKGGSNLGPAFALIALLTLLGAMFLGIVGIDALEYRNDFQFFADSPTYHDAAREGPEQDALRIGAGEHEFRDPRCERHRLARAGAGDNQHRAGNALVAQPVLHGAALLLVEHGERVGARRGDHGHTVNASSFEAVCLLRDPARREPRK